VTGAGGVVLGAVAVATDTPVLLLAVAPVIGGAYGVCMTAGLQAVQRLAHPDARGGITGLYYVLTYIGFALPYVLALATRVTTPIVALGATAGLIVGRGGGAAARLSARSRRLAAHEADRDAGEDDGAAEHGVDRRLLAERGPGDQRAADRLAEQGERYQVGRRGADRGVEQAVADERGDHGGPGAGDVRARRQPVSEAPRPAAATTSAIAAIALTTPR